MCISSGKELLRYASTVPLYQLRDLSVRVLLLHIQQAERGRARQRSLPRRRGFFGAAFQAESQAREQHPNHAPFLGAPVLGHLHRDGKSAQERNSRRDRRCALDVKVLRQKWQMAPQKERRFRRACLYETIRKD